MPITRQVRPGMRLLGIDDGPFAFTDRSVALIGVLARIDGHVDGVLRTDVSVDGTDATEVIAAMVEGSRFSTQPAVMLLDGAAVGGFNVLDLDGLFARLGITQISITRDRPDRDAIHAALESRFGADAQRRMELLHIDEVVEVPLPTGALWCRFVGIDQDFGAQVVRAATPVGVVPAPLRLAHLIATAVVRGSSHGAA